MKSLQVRKISFTENSSTSLFDEELHFRMNEIGKYINGERNELPVIPPNNISQNQLIETTRSAASLFLRLMSAVGLKKGYLGSLEKSNLSGAKISKESFYKIDLNKSEFHYNVFEEVDFSYAGLKDIRFSGNIYDECLFKNTVFQHTKLLGLFTKCSFENVNGEINSSFVRGTFIECKFKNVVMDTFCFAGSTFINCQFDNVKISRKRELGPPSIQTDFFKFDDYSKSQIVKTIGAGNWLPDWNK